MKYDDAEYYFLDFETELPNENGGRHMGLFLEWAVLRGLAGDELMERSEALRRGETTGLELLFDHCDGKLWDGDLNDEGNAFAADAYERWCMDDFIEAMNCTAESSVDEIFGAEITPQRHDRVLWQWDRRYSDWLRQFGLPDKDALLERLLVAIQPVAEAAGFPRVPNNAWGTHQVCATFECAAPWGYRCLEMWAVDSPELFYGVRVRLYMHHEQVYDAIYAEKQLDQGMASALQSCADVSFASLAEGWDGPLHDYLMRDCGFWIFRDAQIETFASWLAGRLHSFALPMLRSLDGIDGLALAYGTQPMSASPIYEPRDPYAALLSAEMARHPRLGQMLTETETAIRAEPGRLTWDQESALVLIKRIRERSKGWLS
jgi:hypothetical protein